MCLVHYGFTREEAYFMPLNEYSDYILLINEELEKEKQQQMNSTESSEKEPKTIGQIANNSSAI